MQKYIINADDYGLNEHCTMAINEAFEKLLISSTTMCANGSYYYEACRIAKEKHLENHIGIHLNLTEGTSLTEAIKLDRYFCDENGFFHGRINRKKCLTREQKKLVYKELSAQIEKMRISGLPITHADSHHHIHTAVFIAPTIISVLKYYNIKKIRLHRNIGKIKLLKKIGKKIYNLWLKLNGFKTVSYFGSLEDILDQNNIKKDTIYEIMVHPEYDKNNVLIDKTSFDLYSIGRPLAAEIKRLTNMVMYLYKEL